MNEYKKSLIIILVQVLLYSCTYPFEPIIDPEDTRILVVEGLITDETGPFQVKLTYSFEMDDMQHYGEPVNDADVIITDDIGNYFYLLYDANGWYKTEDTLLLASPGNTYSLHITTSEGDEYESLPIYMKGVPEIDSIYFQEVTKPTLVENQIIQEKWLDICVNTHDPTNQTTYWKWNFEETWEVRTPKDSVLIQLYIEDETDSNFEILGETGFFFFRANVEFNKGNIIEGWDSKKDRCWVEKKSSSIIIETTEDKQKDIIEKQIIQSIPRKSGMLDIKYSILVEQTSLSKNLYNYFSQLKKLNEQSGNLYENIPAQIHGNIVSCNNNKIALGYFSASSLKTKRIIIQPFEHEIETENPYSDCIFFLRKTYTLGTIVETSDPKFSGFVGTEIGDYNNPWCTDCRYAGTNVMPDYWEEEQ